MDIFTYQFMQKALLVGGLLGLIIPCIGVLMVTKRYSMIGDALSHMSLAGVSLGLIFNFNPIIGALITCLIAAFSLEIVKTRIPQHQEVAIAMLTSTGIGLAGLLSGIVPSTNNFNSFLFGSIIAIDNSEVYLVIAITFIVLLTFFLFYKEFFLSALDEKNAKLLGINVKLVNLGALILTALTVSVAARTVGALIVSSLMVIPVVCSLQVSKSYKQTILFSIVFGLSFMLIGLVLSYYLNLKPGGTIVLLGIITFIVLSLAKVFKIGGKHA